MTMSAASVKIRRAQAASRTGRNEKLFQAGIRTIGFELIESLSAAQIAALVDRIADSWEQGRILNNRMIVERGQVWDERGRQMLAVRHDEPIPLKQLPSFKSTGKQ